MSRFLPPSCSTMLMLSALALIVYNEYLEFFLLKQSQWAGSRDSILHPTESPAASRAHNAQHQTEPVRILFVADPQIQGYRDEPALLGYITRWDADLYLRKYFHEALSYIKPDVIITMGDLLDEGSIASADDFEIYAERFKKLFYIPDDLKPAIIHLSGDNDIGGEGTDPLTAEKIQRFERHFGPVTEAVHYKHVSFFKVNFLPYLHSVSKAKDEALKDLLHKMAKEAQDSTVRIVLSHVGMSSSLLYRHIEVLRTLKPHYAFSAHSHQAGYTKHSLAKLLGTFRQVYKAEKDYGHDLTLEEENLVTTEYRIPTCSYRMGVQRMAYSAAVIDENGRLHYTLLELPSRFKQLYRYAMFGVFSAILLLWMCLTFPRRR